MATSELPAVPGPLGDVGQRAREIYLRSLDSPASQRSMRSAMNTIDRIAATPPRVNLSTLDGVVELRRRIVDGRPVASANRLLSAVRGTFDALHGLGVLDHETLTAYRKALRSARGDDAQPKGRVLELGELAALMTACAADPTPKGRRDAAIIALLVSTGMRRAELVSIDVEHYDPAERTFSVVGKGRRRRTVHVTNGAQRALDDWLAVRGSDPGPLLWRAFKGGRVVPQRISGDTVQMVLEQRAREAKLSARALPHDFRRTLGTTLLDQGEDLSVVADVLGHRRLDTTRIYDRRGEAAKRKAVGRIHVPYVAPQQPTLDDQEGTDR